MEIKVELKFKCTKCDAIIENDYTQEDVLNLKQLDLVCQNCGAEEKVETKVIIEKAKEEAIEEIKRNFKTI